MKRPRRARWSAARRSTLSASWAGLRHLLQCTHLLQYLGEPPRGGYNSETTTDLLDGAPFVVKDSAMASLLNAEVSLRSGGIEKSQTGMHDSVPHAPSVQGQRLSRRQIFPSTLSPKKSDRNLRAGASRKSWEQTPVNGLNLGILARGLGCLFSLLASRLAFGFPKSLACGALMNASRTRASAPRSLLRVRQEYRLFNDFSGLTGICRQLCCTWFIAYNIGRHA